MTSTNKSQTLSKTKSIITDLPIINTPPPIKKEGNHLHKLERKHSSGDLHSRLKTRKLLGVGETDDGDVHRSKLSQILGHSEQLHIRTPRGLRVWQFLLPLFSTVISIWALLLPKSLFVFTLQTEADDDVILPIRLYGSALLGYSLLLWGAIQTVDREMIRWSLLSSTVYFLLQILVSSLALLQMGVFIEKGVGILIYPVLLMAGSAYFYWSMFENNRPSRPRRSASAHDISSGSMKKML